MVKLVCPPVLILAHRRAREFETLLARVLSEDPPVVYISCDGPRNLEDEIQQNLMRQMIEDSHTDIPIRVRFLQRNLGLRSAVLSAVDWFFENENSGIVLEDDLVPSPEFFSHCAEGLQRYSDVEKVLQISGYRRLNGFVRANGHVFHSRIDCWGWATWKDRWENFRGKSDSEMPSRPGANFAPRALVREIEAGHRKAIANELDSWAYSWAQYGLATKSLALVPAGNTIQNVGFGDGATHTKSGKSAIPRMFDPNTAKFPTEVRPTLSYVYTEDFLFRTHHLARKIRKKVTRFAIRITIWLWHLIRGTTNVKSAR